jgi:hypothetical protein
MKETVTVNQALNKGRIKLIFLPLLIFIAFIALGLIFRKNQLIGEWILLLSFILGILFSWLSWSYFVNDWKIWAYENVKNVHELKQKAIEEKLIWESGSWFEKTEFKNDEQKAKLKLLEKKFLEKDVYHDDLNVPEETVISYSKGGILFQMIIYILSFFVLAYYVENIYFRILICVIGIYLLYDNLKTLMDKSIQIIINDRGIQLKDKKLKPWNKIFNDHVYAQTTGKSSTNYLIFNNKKISIEDLDIKFDELENLLHVYRVRFEKNNS